MEQFVSSWSNNLQQLRGRVKIQLSHEWPTCHNRMAQHQGPWVSLEYTVKTVRISNTWSNTEFYRFCCACSSLPAQIWTGLSLSLELQLFMNPIKINFWWNCLTRYSRWSCCLFGFVLHSSLLYEPTAVSRCRSCHAGRTSACSWSARNYLTQRPNNVWSCDQFSRLSALWTAWTRSRGGLVFENTQKALRNTVYTAYTVYIYIWYVLWFVHIGLHWYTVGM